MINLSCRLRERAAGRSDLMKWFCHYYEDAQPQSWEFKVNALEHDYKQLRMTVIRFINGGEMKVKY